jgi:mRNA interferase YafQ
MRTTKLSSRFKRDYKRVQTGEYSKAIQLDLPAVLKFLVIDEPLPPRYRDHALTGEWKGFRDCHIHPDLVLIYRKPNADLLELARLGSHSELFKK